MVEEALNVEEVGGRRESQEPTLIVFINVSSTKSAEGATPNRAVRKGCYSVDA